MLPEGWNRKSQIISERQTIVVRRSYQLIVYIAFTWLSSDCVDHLISKLGPVIFSKKGYMLKWCGRLGNIDTTYSLNGSSRLCGLSNLLSLPGFLALAY